MLKSIVTSEESKKSGDRKARYSFEAMFNNLSEMNEEVNERIQKCEERQSMSLRKAGNIRSK